MDRRAKSIVRIQHLATIKYDQALLILKKTYQDHKQESQKLDALQSYFKEYHDKLTGSSDILTIVQCQNFLESLHFSISEQKSRVDRLSATLEKLTAKLVQLRSVVKGFDILVTKHKKIEQMELQKTEEDLFLESLLKNVQLQSSTKET